MAQKYTIPIELYAGDKWKFSFLLFNDEDTPNIDYATGYTLTLHMKKYASDSAPSFVFSGSSALIIDNELLFEKGSTETNIEGTNYLYDLQVTDVNGDNTTLLYDEIKVINQISQ